ncbi:ribulose 1,5-bisphosphate carboxylase [Frigidibacter albus]|uniref:Ribulose 1,5-bisphosphate carboxylase n=1 Tax=Frigidibacter albus TaxID=1465486 RepID=A0A6L8VD49_9RHOB|nr:RuBisCO large subunit C-terminal-like domain-containing protein [Frigidibacter albus]MZQ87596.1 ribulose 1,5-bisphosphate carboxylase [Frigidibacter albus]NBE29502.1 ribulose 1,5-bisphosphate carboxylase [Frigidibacter albus]GGH44473.1 ribulose bisphosphate carboxylaseoxygenase large subunit [Frigidibacter albus]
MIRAAYLVETPCPIADVAAMMAGEQSAGTFMRVEGETDALRARFGATVVSTAEVGRSETPSLRSAWAERKGLTGPRGIYRVVIDYPEDNVGVNLPTLASVVAGNLYDLGEVTGLKLLDVSVTPEYRARYDLPAMGISGTRASAGVQGRPMFGTIIKPNIGLAPDQIADLVQRLCEAGTDFVKDDEIAGTHPHAPVQDRIRAVMDRVRRHRDRSGKLVMVAFNITDETDAMRRHADLLAAEEGTCAMVSLNWVGLSAVQTLRRHSGLAIHGHRNGFGGMGRHPLLGMGVRAYQVLYRLAGIDHMHVHGMGGKFSDLDEDVTEAALHCLQPMGEGDDRVMPIFSSGQWAGTLPHTLAQIGSDDLMFLSGGGIMAHPGGPAAGLVSLRQAHEAVVAGVSLADHARAHPELAQALATFGPKG